MLPWFSAASVRAAQANRRAAFGYSATPVTNLTATSR